MKILINLGSSLLGEALKEALEREQEEYQLLVDTDFSEIEVFCPDFIIADCHSLRRGMPLSDPVVKVILLDYGLGEDEITSLLLAHKIDGVLSTHPTSPISKKRSRQSAMVKSGLITAKSRH